MPGGNMRDENLEERIERIRKRDEEIEKKHREAEADRLAALKANAMVKMTAPADDDWPKAHKYDTLDFTYDVKDQDVGDAAAAIPIKINAIAKKKNGEETARLQRSFKKFPDGQGPPADPTYNFLADAERDGKSGVGVGATDIEKKDWRANSGLAGSNGGSNLNRRSNNNSFNRGRNGVKGKNGSSKGKQNYPGGGDEYNSWKNERERIDDARVNRQKSVEGKWRREWDNEKLESEANGQVKNAVPTIAAKTNADGQQMQFERRGLFTDEWYPSENTKINYQQMHQQQQHQIHQLQQQQQQKQQQQQHQNESVPIVRSQINALPQQLSDLAIEKRGNITVSVTRDGEVKSVKLESARAIGTGRVGSGATLRQNTQQQQQQQLQQQQLQQQQLQQQQLQQQQLQQQQLQQQQLQQQQLQQQQLQQQQLQQQHQRQDQQHHPPQQQFIHNTLNINPEVKPNSGVPILSRRYDQNLYAAQMQAPAPLPMPASNPSPVIANGNTFKLPSVQDRLTRNRIYFDESLAAKAYANAGAPRTIANNQ